MLILINFVANTTSGKE